MTITRTWAVICGKWQFQTGKARQIWSFCATRERISSRIRVCSITIYVVMPDEPERAPLQELQVPQGVNLADPAAAGLLQQLLLAQNAVNVSQATQESQSAVARTPDKQSQKGNTPRANWLKEEERCSAELKLGEADRERQGRTADKEHKKLGKMTGSTVCRCL